MNDIILSNPLPIDQNAAAVYLASLGTESGRRSQEQAVRVIAHLLKSEPDNVNWGALRYSHTTAIRSKLMSAYAPATANKILVALRQTLKHAFLLGQIPADEYQKAIQLKPVTGETLPRGREITLEEIRKLLEVCKLDTSNTGIRDAAIIALMYSSGMRREEVAKLNISDFENGQIRITGKRNKERTAYVTNGSLDALNAWLLVRGSQTGKLFVKIHKSGKLGESLTAQAIYFILNRRAVQADVKPFSPHDLRRTNVTHLLKAGADISTVANLVGHKNIQTTKRYDKRGEEAKLQAAQLLTVPY